MPEHGSIGYVAGDNTGRIGTVESRSLEETPLIEEALIEEVSIDGMCGVY